MKAIHQLRIPLVNMHVAITKSASDNDKMDTVGCREMSGQDKAFQDIWTASSFKNIVDKIHVSFDSVECLLGFFIHQQEEPFEPLLAVMDEKDVIDDVNTAIKNFVEGLVRDTSDAESATTKRLLTSDKVSSDFFFAAVFWCVQMINTITHQNTAHTFDIPEHLFCRVLVYTTTHKQY